MNLADWASAPAPRLGRVLHFPADPSLGIIYTRPAGTDGRWVEKGHAQNTVSIPAGMDVYLLVQDPPVDIPLEL